ncbi:MAG: SDR family oxidoreductase [Myxococcota bacterium]|nr:SDR family oxidoreductase [Myxococcota bacterium]
MPDASKALFDLTGRAAIVSGASRGIGRAIAHGLAEAGAAVTLAARNGELCAEVAEEINAAGGRAIGVSFDLADPDTLGPVVTAAVDAFGRLDVLVNNGAILKPHLIERLSADEMDLLHGTNVRGPVLLSRLAFPHLRASGRGSIVNLAAVAGHRPMKGLGAYGASKAALISWTRVMAQEWTPQGVRVNGLTPGSVATDMILPRDPEQRERFIEELGSQNLFGRIADPREMIGPVLFLASDASSFMTGQVLVVDGGLMA